MEMTCENCDSIYALTFKPEDTTGGPEYCPFCGEPIEETDDYEPDDYAEPKWDDQ